MKSRYSVPRDLMAEPWWPRVKDLSMEEVFVRLQDVDRIAVDVLFTDLCILRGLPPSASRQRARQLTVRETLGTWVASWTPRTELTAFGRLERLRSALAVIGQVYGTPAAEPKPVALGPIGKMEVRVLSERRMRAHVTMPPGVSLPSWGAQSLNDLLGTMWGRADGLRQWLAGLATELTETLERERPERSALAERWRKAQSGAIGKALLAMREPLAASQLPVSQAMRAGSTLQWQRASDEVVVHVPGMLSCLTDSCGSATISLLANDVSVRCRQGTDPCRLKLAAVERLLETLSSDDPAGAELRAHLALPDWQRMLGRLRAAGSAERDERRFGWILKSPLELEPAWISPRKNGVGWKSSKLSNAELDGLTHENARDEIALSLFDAQSVSFRGFTDGQRSAVAKTLSTLVGGDNVYFRGASGLVQVQVKSEVPRCEVVATDGAEGGTRVVMRWGERVTEAAELPSVGSWSLDIDEAARIVRVGFWSRSALRVADVLRASGRQVLPIEASATLAETLLAVSESVVVTKDASWLGLAYPPAPDVVFRLGFDGPRGAKVLTVEACVRPIAELGALVPGEGEEVIPVRRDGRVGHVVRQLEAERAAAEVVATALGLPTQPTLAWRIEGLEAAVAIWTALNGQARASSESLHVEWRTKEPKVQTQRRADKLRLKLGLKKDWLDVRGGFALDGGELPLAELLAALRDNKRFVQVDDERVLELGEALTKELAPLLALARTGAADKEGTLRTSLLAAPLIAELQALGAEVDGPPEWLVASERLAESATLEVPVPDGLLAELRPYQVDGIQWAARLAHWAHGACLADEMGLGKTLQALALLLRRRALGRALVVAPTSVVPNWLREAARFTPGLQVSAIARGASLAALDQGAAVVVTSWDLIVRHEERFNAIEWATVVLDEAHAMKNAATRRAQVAKALPAGFVLALTGTPVENRPSELWSLFQAVAPGLLGSAESFRETHARAIETGDANASRRLARLVRPFILRRKKAEVASDLPETTEVRVDVVLSADERERYERVRRSALAELAKEDAHGEGGARKVFKVLVVLTRLRQLACHARLVEPQAGPSSAKLERLLELASELRDEGRKMLVFSQFTELLALVRKAFDEAGLSYAYLDGSTPAERRIDEVDRFQSGAVDAFLLSLKAGGVGLNLTAATEVIHLDPWWNPAVEDQATGRAHRIGQDKPVTVYRMVAQGTIEEQILGLHGDKRLMVASLLEGTGSAQPVTADELIALLSEEGLEASAPESEPEPEAPTLAALPPAPASSSALPSRSAEPPITRVTVALQLAAGAPMSRADIVAATLITESEWQQVRAALEAHAQVELIGVARGRRYRWIMPVP